MKRTLAFWICLFTSVALFIGGFFVPPIGVIDGSVLKAVGLLLGFGTVAQIESIAKMMKEVDTLKLSKGDASIEITKDTNN